MKNIIIYLIAIAIFATLFTSFKTQGVITTSKTPHESIKENNEIVIHPDRIDFIDPTTGDIRSSFNRKANNPYYKPSLLPAATTLRGFETYRYNNPDGGGNYALAPLSTQEVIDLFQLQDAPAPVPKDYKFGYTWNGSNAVAKSNTVVIQYMVAFSSCYDVLTQNHCGELLLATKNTFIVLNSRGKIIWQWKDYYTQADFSLSSNGRYLGICYGGIAEDYDGDYIWPAGTLIIDLQTHDKFFDQPINTGNCLGEIDNIFGFIIDGVSKENIIICKLDPEKRITYTLEVNRRKYFDNTDRDLEAIEGGFYQYGKTYLYERDFKQIPFDQPLITK